MPSVIDSTNRTRLNQQFALLLDLISEGEIEGLVNGHGSVYLNETPIAPPSKSATVSYKTGTVTTDGTTTVEASSDLFAGIDLSEGARYIQIRSAAGASTLDSIHYVNDTTITVTGATFAGSQELNTFNAVFGTQAEFKNIRIPGAGPDGTEYVGSIIEVVDSTTAIVSPPLSTQVASGTAVEVDYFAQITGITDNDTCTVATGGMRSITSTALISPARATRTTYNFRNTSAAFRAGTLHQSIPSFSTAAPSASFIASGPASDLQWSSAHGGTAAPVTINGSTYLNLSAAQKQEIDQVVLTLEFPAGLLYVQKDGGQHSATAEFRVVLRYKKSASATSWTETTLIGPTNPAAWPSQGFRRDDPNRNTNGSIRGRTNGSFLQEFKINLQQFQPLYDWELDLYRTTPDNPDDYNNNFVTDTVILTTRLRTIQANIFDKFSYPNSAYAAVTFNAEDFSNIPTRGYHIRGKKVRVPTNYITREEIDSSNPLAQEAKYTRNVTTGIDTNTYQYWNGAFRGDSSLSDTNVNFRKVYTNNPAWIFYDILTNKNYGLGEYIEESDIDVFSLYEIARYCDEMVPNGKGGTEPRFTCNVYFQSKQEAYKVLKDLASTFRGMMYWIDGQITAVQDRPKEPVYTFTQGNVIDGLFSYESTGQRARVNQVNVTWNDPDQFYKQDVTTVDDIDDIAKRGKIMSKDVVAFGCTSEGQATRVGRWHLLTSQFENEIVKFETSINAGFLRPGDLIKIQDAKADNVEFSGRLSTGSTTTSLNLDRKVVLQAGESYNLYLIYPEAGTYLEQASATINSTNYVRGDLILLDNSGNAIVDREDAVNLYDENTNEKVQVAFSPNSRLEVKPISTGASTVSTLSVSSAFSSAPSSEVIWAVSNVNEYQRVDAPVTYRILGISEDSINKYSIVASKYAPQKYDELEKQWAVYVPPYVPTPSRDVDVPSVTGLRIEVVPAIGARDGSNSGALDAVVSWNEPTETFTDSNGNSETTRYRFIDFYEVQHNFYSSKSGADAGTINVIPASRTSEIYSNVGAGEYTVRVRVRNISGHFSPWTEVTQAVSATQQPGLSYDRSLKVVKGGSINSPLSFDEGVLTVDNSNYTFVSTAGQAYSVTSATANQSTVDFSSVSSGDTAYWLFDYSDTSDPWKILETHTDTTVQNTAGQTLTVSYWKEYGASNNGLSLVTGTVSTSAGSNQISGSSTSFTSDFSEGDLIKVSPNNSYGEVSGAEYLEVLSVESDTVLYTRTNATKTQTAKYAYKQLFKVDFVNDNLLAEVTNSGGTFSIEYYVIKSGRQGVDGTGAITIDINPLTVSVSSASDGSVQASDLTETAFEIYVYEGDTRLIVDTVPAPYAEGSFRWTLTDPSTVTRGTSGGSGTYDIIRLPDNTPIGVSFQPLVDIDDNVNSVTIPIEITVVRQDGTEVTFNRNQFISKSSVGETARAVSLTVGTQAFVYDEDGLNPSVASTTVTATPINTTGTPTYVFTLDGSPVDAGDVNGNQYTYTPQSSYSDMPDQIKVVMTDGSYTATDILTIFGVKPGAAGEDGLDAYTVILSNESHTAPEDNEGAIDLTGSGTSVSVFKGTTELNSVSGTPTTGQFSISATGSGVTLSSTPINVSGNSAVIADHTALSGNVGTVSISINVEDFVTIDKTQTIARASLGNAGPDGLRSIQGYLYQEKTTTGAPAEPAGNTYTFSTGVVSGTDIDDAGDTNVWKNTPNEINPASTNTHYTIRYYGTESAAESSTITVDYSTTTGVPYTNFTGVVTFSGGTFSQGGSDVYDTTTIDGGVIKTGAIKGGSTPPADANSAPGVGESGAYLDIAGGKFVFGDSAKSINWDGTNLNISGNVTIGNTPASTVESGAGLGATAFQPGDSLTSGVVGPVTITGTSLYQGAGNFGQSDTGFYLDNLGQFSLRDKFSFNQSSLFVDGNIDVDSYVRAGTGSNTAIMSGRDIDNFAFWAGAGFASDGGPSGGTAPFRVTRSGKVIMTNFALYSTSGTKLFDSEDGLSTLPQTVVADSSGTLVDIVSEELISATDTFTVTLSSTQTITANFAYPVGYLFYSGSSIPNALANIPSSFTVTMQVSTDGTNYSTFGSAQTFSRVTSGTATPSQFRAVANTFTIPPIIYGASGTTLNVAYIVDDEGALDEGYTLLGSTSQSLGQGTYYFRMLISADQGSLTGALDTTKTREVRLSTSGSGFTISGTAISDAVAGSATTSWVYDNFVEKGEDENVTLGGDLTVTGNFTVNGTTTTINSTTLTVDDKNIVLASGAADASAANGAGITIDGANVSLTYTSSSNRFTFSRPIDFSGSFYSTVGPAIYLNNGDITGINSLVFDDPANTVGEGISWPRSGDANFDTLVSNDGTLYYYPNRVSAETSYTGASTVWHSGNDGAGSGLNADLLDGQHASAFEAADVTILHRGADIGSQDWNTFIDGTEASWNTVLNHSGSNRPSSSYGYGTALSFSKAGEAKLQIYAPETASSGNGLWYRTGWNTGYRAWQKIWDSGNDGAGSGLDADLLDGQQGSYYLNTATTFGGDVSGTYNNLQIANDSHTHDSRYYTETEADSRFVNVTGDSMSGSLNLTSGSFNISGVAAINSSREGNFNTRLQVNGIDSAGNVSAPSNGAIFSGYGIIGNRNPFYITNGGGAVQIGNGSSHNANPGLTVSSTAVTIESGRILNASGAVTNTALDFASNDQYASMRVIRNAASGAWGNGLYLGYGNSNSGLTYLYGGGSTSARIEINASGGLTAAGDVAAFSDERLKTDIQTLDGSKVYEMRGVSFTKDGEKGSGVIAQELEKVAPELVHEGEYKSVAYGNLVGYLIEAVKDLKKEVEELKKQLK